MYYALIASYDPTPLRPEGDIPEWYSNIAASKDMPGIPPWKWDNHPIDIDDIATLEFWKLKKQIASAAENQAKETIEANPDWYRNSKKPKAVSTSTFSYDQYNEDGTPKNPELLDPLNPFNEDGTYNPAPKVEPTNMMGSRR